MSFSIENGVLEKYADNGDADIVIPEGVNVIRKEAFRCCKSIVSVILPEGVTSVGERAFYGCSSLTNVIFPKTVSYIAPDAFDGTPWLKAQTGDFVTVNGYAFKNMIPQITHHVMQ